MAWKKAMYPRTPFTRETTDHLPHSSQSGDNSSHSNSSSGISSQRGGYVPGTNSSRTIREGGYQYPSQEEIERLRDRSIASMIKKTQKQLEMITRVAKACKRPARTHVDVEPLSATRDWVFDPFGDVVEEEDDDRPQEPFVFHHGRRVFASDVRFLPRPTIPAPALPGLSPPFPFIFHPTFDVDAVERSMFCPRPPPSFFPQLFYVRPSMIPSSHY